MSDNPVSNISRIDPQSIQVQAQASQAPANQGQSNSVQPDQSQNNKVASSTTSAVPEDGLKKEIKDETQKKVAGTENKLGRQTNLKFHVDPKNHQVTVWIMDRATNKVISTIPADKIKDVPPGDLLQYSA